MPQNPFTIAAPVFSYKTGRKLTKLPCITQGSFLFDFIRWFWKRKRMILLFGPAAKRIYPISVYIPQKLRYNGNKENPKAEKSIPEDKTLSYDEYCKMSVVSIQI